MARGRRSRGVRYGSLPSGEEGEEEAEREEEEVLSGSGDGGPPPSLAPQQRVWAGQTRALVLKSAMVARRRRGAALFMVLAPLLALVALRFIEVGTRPGKAASGRFGLGAAELAVRRCRARDAYDHHSRDERCTTLAFAPSEGAFGRVARRVADEAGLSVGPGRDVELFASEEEMLVAAGRYGGRHVLVSMTGEYDGDTVNGSRLAPPAGLFFGYNLFLNATSVLDGGSLFGAPGLRDVLSVQRAVDGALAAELAAQRGVAQADAGPFRVVVDPFEPVEAPLEDDAADNAGGYDDPDDDDGYDEDDDGDNVLQSVSDHSDAFRVASGPLLVLSACMVMTTAANFVLAEKRAQLLGALRVMGLRESAYWVSWQVAFAALCALAAVVACLGGTLMGYPFYRRCSFAVLLPLHGLFFGAMAAMGCFLGALVSQPRWFNTFTVLVLFVSVIMSLDAAAQESGDAAVSFGRPVLWRFFTWMMPWTWFSKVWLDVVRVTGAPGGRGRYSLGDLVSAPAAPDGVTAAHALLQLFSSSLFFVLAAWYCAQAFASQLGASRDWYFPLTRDFWLGSGGGAGGAVVEGDTVARERALSARDGTLRTHMLSKAYDGVSAVREVSIEMRAGEVTAVLGSNGAGKSTLVNVLCGLTDATFGSAFAFGLHLRDDREQVQRMTGVCHQQNLLWPELTAAQHVALHASMRGAAPAALPAMVDAKIAEFGLGEWRDAPASSMSGGTQRRLCLAAATVNSPRLVFLDEPTTGVDIIQRQQIWRAMAGLRARGSVVVLTTHSLAEAEETSDRVAILSGGRLRAHGTPLFLTETYGRGYQLQLTAGSADVVRVAELAARTLPLADVTAQAAGSVTVGMPREALRHVPAFFAALAETAPSVSAAEVGAVAAAAAAGPGGGGTVGAVTEWSFSSSTLEEVFLRLCHQEAAMNAPPPPPAAVGAPPPPPPPCGLCRTRPAEPVTLFTSTGVPVRSTALVCLACADGAGGGAASEAKEMEDVEAEEEEEKEESDNVGVGASDSPLDVAALLADIAAGGSDEPGGGGGGAEAGTAPLDDPPADAAAEEDSAAAAEERARRIENYVGRGVPSVWSQTRAIALKNAEILGKGRKALFFKALYLVWSAYLVASLPLSPVSWPLPGEMGSLFAQAAQGAAAVYSSRGDPLPCPAPAPGSSAGPAAACSNLAPGVADAGDVWYHAAAAAGVSLSEYDAFGLGAGELLLSSPEAGENRTVGWRDARGPVADAVAAAQRALVAGEAAALPQAGFEVHASAPASGSLDVRLRFFPAGSDAYSSRSTGDAERDPASFLVPALGLLSNALLRTGEPPGEPPLVLATATVLPTLPPPAAAAEPEFCDFALMRFLLVALMLFPTFAPRLCSEHEEGLFHAMRLAGLRPFVYWAANCAFDACVAAAWGLAYLALLYLFGAELMARAGVAAWALLACVVSPLVQVTMSLLVALVVRRPGAATALSYVVMLTVAVASAVAASVDNGRWPQWMLLTPPLALGRAASQLLRYGRANSYFVEAAGAAVGVSLLVASLAVCAHAARARRAAGIEWPWAKSGAEPVAASAAEAAAEDADVAEERARVDGGGGGGGGGGGLVLRGLFKRFAPTFGGGKPKVAVAGVTLAVEPSTVTVLCGVNGAGKSTLISILAGALTPTGGSASVDGYDVAAQRGEVFSRLGVCPQEDRVWGELSVRSHLLLYARLKGVSREREDALAQHMAEEVGLDGDSMWRAAGELSGGQRRRLSVAASLVGNPSVWLVDEPGTGLSPEHRRHLWDIIARQRQRGRAVLLTTHDLQEAETVCSRIAVMSRGRLVAVGTPQRLKRRFGSGYKLSFGLSAPPDEPALARLTAFVRRGLCARAALSHVSGASAVYTLPQDATAEVLALFGRLEGARDALRAHLGAEHWAVRPSSLREVFLARVRESEPDEVGRQVRA